MVNLLFSLSLLAGTNDATADIAALFRALRIPAAASYPYKLPKPVIRVYAVDDALTKICYVSEDVIYLYENGQVTIPLYAKVFNVKAVNRITYHKNAVGGAFQIWIDDVLELTL